MGSYVDLLEELHTAQNRLNELEAIQAHEAEFQAMRETMEQVGKTLKEVSGQAGDRADKLNELRDTLGKVRDTQGRLKDLTDAVGKVSGGVGKFGKAAGKVSETILDLDAKLDAIEDLIDSADGDPHEIIGRFGEYFASVADRLGPLIKLIPGLGAFITIWTEAIESIRVSVMSIEASVAKRENTIAAMREQFGPDFTLYLEVKTSRQQRREELDRLRERVRHLEDEVRSHPDDPGTPLDVDDREAERQVVGEAEDLAAGQLDKDEAAVRREREELVLARHRLWDAWSRLADLDAARANFGLLPPSEWERARNAEEIADAEAELSDALDAYEEAKEAVIEYADRVRDILGERPDLVDPGWLRDKYGRYTDPRTYWDTDKANSTGLRARLDEIRQRVRSSSPPAPPADPSVPAASVPSAAGRTPVGAGVGGRLTGTYLVGGVVLVMVAVIAVVVTRGGPDADSVDDDQPSEVAVGPLDGSSEDDASAKDGDAGGVATGSQEPVAAAPTSAQELFERALLHPGLSDDPERSYSPLDVRTYGLLLTGIARTDLPPPEEFDDHGTRAAGAGFVDGMAQEWRRPAGDQEDMITVIIADFGDPSAAAHEAGVVIRQMAANDGAAAFPVADVEGATGTTFIREMYICLIGEECELDSRWTAYDVVFTFERFVAIVSVELTEDAGPDEAIAIARSLTG